MYSNLTTAAPNITAAQIGDFFKDATFGVPSGDVGEHREPGAGRDDRPRQAVRRAAHLRRHAAGADVRDRLRDRRGPAVLHRRAAPRRRRATSRRSRAAPTSSMDESVWASEPYTQQDLVNQVEYGLAHSPYGPQIFADATNYVAGINAYIAKPRTRCSRRPRCRPSTRALGRAAAAVQRRGPRLDRHARRRHLRQRRRRPAVERGALPEAAEALRARAPDVAGSPELVHRARASTAHGAPGHEAAARSRRPPPSPPVKRHRPAPQARRGSTAGYATLRSFVDPSDPEAPTTVRGQRFPYQTLPRPSKATLRTSRCPIRARSSTSTTSSPARPPSAADARASAARGRGNALGLGLGPTANAGPGPARVPARHVERAARQRRPQRQRPPARRDGTAGLLLRARRS